jgi:cytochrome c oxidase accessory protein FixG
MSMPQSPASESPEGQVLSTLNSDGTRRWLHPRVSPGRFLHARRVVAWLLIALFVALPWISINGKPSILLDITAREFTFFGTTFLPTDTLLLMLFLAAVFVTIFLLTALFGRLWCGWACPQTVYMEFVFRPLERLFDGPPHRRKRGHPGARGVRRVAKHVVFLIVSLLLAHVFVAYFVGVEALFDWVRQSPFDHPTAFLVMAAVTFLMLFDFGYFREQMCILACPYGRFQSVLLDRSSLIVTYDEERGEPRGRKKREAASGNNGDCVDCSLCVVTCPTGIDIRKGLQMECIGCAQCIDACDAVMDKVGRERGLIRYSSQEALESGKPHLLRPRVLLYPLVLIAILVAFALVLTGRSAVDLTVLREGSTAYHRNESGLIENPVRIKIVNRTQGVRHYTVDVDGLPHATIVTDAGSIELGPNETTTVAATILAPADHFHLGRARIDVLVLDEDGNTTMRRFRLQGPFASGATP